MGALSDLAPVQQASPSAPLPRPQPPTDPAIPLPPLILLIEDQADVRASTVMLLEIWGLRVKAAANGREGLHELGRGSRPELVLLDLDMPVMDGLEFLRRLRAGEELRAAARLPVVLLTGSWEGDARLKTARALADGYLKKPADPEELKIVLDRWAKAP